MIFKKIIIFIIFIMFDLEESASHPLPLLEGVPQVDISRSVSSFGFASFHNLAHVVLLQWIAAGPPGKSI